MFHCLSKVQNVSGKESNDKFYKIMDVARKKLRVRNLVVSDLRLEMKGSRFKSDC